ncbi:BQ5605_C050g12470 [Microbotryum silenes-dioicae]|uniref:BQ5605_C050g12470 protein n=1 Tax=Microbotryum silenes-dioicae TaxID=796604 RepID=A0A2X0MSF8_9BASI|nr:BQ5605_C050g12470 [Microbotryum silenes-dioicae]
MDRAISLQTLSHRDHVTQSSHRSGELLQNDTDHYFFGCFDSRNVWIATRGVLCNALGCDTIDDADYTTLQRLLFGLPKLKAKLSDQEGAGRTIKIFTGMGLEMISSGRGRMQKHGTRMESMERKRVHQATKAVERQEGQRHTLLEKRRNASKVEQEGSAAERYPKRVMYGHFGAPEDEEKKKQGTVGGAIANGNANAD